MKEIEFSRWLFELPAKQHNQFSPSGSPFLHCLSLPSKSHCENSISSIFLESPHQVDMKNVFQSSKHFLGYFNTLETHSDLVFPCSITPMSPEKLQNCHFLRVLAWRKNRIKFTLLFHADLSSHSSEIRSFLRQMNLMQCRNRNWIFARRIAQKKSLHYQIFLLLKVN